MEFGLWTGLCIADARFLQQCVVATGGWVKVLLPSSSICRHCPGNAIGTAEMVCTGFIFFVD
jgi:hypothetical protein